MHSVTQSAIGRLGRRLSTTLQISRCARRLAGDHGLDGFTMEELAHEAGVSRRTLFNYFPGKVDAVLGPMPEPTDEALDLFREGGPHGDLVQDLRHLVSSILDSQDVDREELARWRSLLATNEKLLAATHDRFMRLSEWLVAEIETREGPSFDRRRARVAIGLLGSLFDSALDAFLADRRRRPITHHFDESLRIARELLG
jgi:AcrR family transcriptional regulator